MDRANDTRAKAGTATVRPHEEVERLAFEFWHQRGAPFGTPEIDWLRAEKELEIANPGAEPALTSVARTIGSALGSVAAIVSADR